MHILDYFSISHTIFKVLGYEVSYIEFIGTVLGLISIWLASKANIYTWHTGIINQLAFFVIFYQVQLYSDMLLQVYFTYVCIYGWIYWKKESSDKKYTISYLKPNPRILICLIIAVSTFLLGNISIKLPTFFPGLFTRPPAYPFTDVLISTMSILACFLIARKRIESWVLWILTDILSIFIYALKGVHFISAEYIVFLLMAIYGLVNWVKLFNNEDRADSGKVYAAA